MRGKVRQKSESSEAPEADPDRTYAIGDLAEEFEITTRTIRFYEIKGLINPKRQSGNRIYDRRDRARLMLILRGKNLGFSLEDIARYLELYSADPRQLAQTRLLLEKVETAIDDLSRKRIDIDRTIRELKDLRAQAQAYLAAQRKEGR